jgi:hypothetical protein
MAYADLTAEQKATLQSFVQLIRSWSGEQARVNNHGDAANTVYNYGASEILALLGNDDVIPNTSGLDGAQSLTKAHVVSITSHVQGILAAYNTSAHRGLWSQAAGAVNMIG